MNVEHLVFLLFGLSVASVAYCWWLWAKSAVKFPPNDRRRWAEFIAVLAGTVSVSLPFIAYLPLVPEIATRLHLAWIMAVLTLLSSFFGRGKLRIAGIVGGGTMCWFWWELKRLGEALAGIYGGQ